MAGPAAFSDEQYPIGSVLDGRYRIAAVLGAGGMGRVYRADHTETGKKVAIKVLHAYLNRNREAAQRFRREAIASSRLDHPNIVGVSESGVLGDETERVHREQGRQDGSGPPPPKNAGRHHGEKRR